MEEPRFSKIQIVFLCTAFFLTGILFRLHGITESLWLDEALMAWRTETLSAVFLTMDGSPPVFPFFVWISRQLFGGEPWALRVPSVLFGALLAPAILVILSGHLSKKWALFSAILAVANPFSLVYSAEAKTYTASALFTLLSFGCLWRMMNQPDRAATWERWTFVLSTALLPSLHHWGAFSMVGQCALLALWAILKKAQWSKSRYLYSTVFVGWCLGALGFLIQLPLTLQARDAIKDATASPFWPHFGSWDTLTYVWGSHLAPPTRPPSIILLAFSLTAVSLVFLAVTQSLLEKRAQWCWMIIFTTLVTLIVQSLTFHFFSYRFEIAYLGLILVLYGLLLSWLDSYKLFATLVAVLILALQGYSLVGYYQIPPRSASGWLTDLIVERKPQTVVVNLGRGFDPLLQAPLAYHLHRLEREAIPLLEFPGLEEIQDAYYPPSSYYARGDVYRDLDIGQLTKSLGTELAGVDRVAVVVWPSQAPIFKQLFETWQVESIQGFNSRREGPVFLIIYTRPDADSISASERTQR